MSAVVHRRCLHHAEREAAARCPECQRFFCRECVAEHDDRVLCTDCLRKITTAAPERKRNLEPLALIAQGAVALTIIWFFFFLVGQTMLAVPARFHEGRIWQTEEAE